MIKTVISRIMSYEFMNNKKKSIDGFVPRRASSSQLGDRHIGGSNVGARRHKEHKELAAKLSDSHDPLGRVREGKELTARRDDVSESLRDLEDSGFGDLAPVKKVSRRERKRLKKEARTRKQVVRRRVFKIILWTVVAVIVLAGGFLAYKTLRASGSVLNGNFFSLAQHEPLKQDANGRSNFLIVGTSEDDPGHEASYLTDSIMIVSVNQETKDAYTFSIPRDLYVDYGQACLSGYRGKINEYFSCINTGTDDAAEQDRLAKTQKFIGDIIGLDVQYGVHVNYTVMRDVVNAIGGEITVTIDSRDPRGVMDSNFDWKCGKMAQRKIKCPPNGHFIDYPNGEVTIDAEHALYLAQARGDRAPTYGFEQSNFDRERNQQMIIVSILNKAMSAGTLTNLGKVTGLIDALGDNLRTNIETKEVRTLMDIAQALTGEGKIKSIDFYTEDDPIFTTGTLPVVGSSVYPKAGVRDYSQLRAFIKKELSSDPFVKEEPVVAVFNGSGASGVALKVAEQLEAKGFMISTYATAPEGTYGAVELYQINTQKPASLGALQKLYGVTPKTTTPPVAVPDGTDFVVIVGDSTAIKTEGR